MYYAIALTGNGNYMLTTFHEKAQRDTVVKYSNGFIPIEKDEVYKYIDPKTIIRCHRKTCVVYNQDGVCCGKFESLYKPLHQQPIYKPEKYACITAPELRCGRTIINLDKPQRIKR